MFPFLVGHTGIFISTVSGCETQKKDRVTFLCDYDRTKQVDDQRISATSMSALTSFNIRATCWTVEVPLVQTWLIDAELRVVSRTKMCAKTFLDPAGFVAPRRSVKQNWIQIVVVETEKRVVLCSCFNERAFSTCDTKMCDMNVTNLWFWMISVC